MANSPDAVEQRFNRVFRAHKTKKRCPFVVRGKKERVGLVGWIS